MVETVAMIWKELTQVANRRRFAFEKALVVFGMSAAFVIMSGVFLREVRRGVTFMQLAQFGRVFFWGSSAVLSLILSVSVMAFAGGMVAEEYAKARLPLLLVTPLESVSILAGKAVSVFARAGTLVVVLLPFFGLLAFFGGAETTSVLAVGAFISTNAWFYGCLGLLLSVVSKKSSSAVNLAIFSAFLWNAAIVVPLFYFRVRGQLPLYSDFLAFSPFVIFSRMVRGGVTGKMLALHYGCNIVVGAVLFAAAAYLFRPFALRRLAGGREKRKSARRAVAAGGKGAPASHSRLVELLGEGMIAKELIRWRPWKAVLSLSWFFMFYCGMFIFRWLTGEWRGVFDAEAHVTYFGFEMGGFFLLLSIQASGRIVGEKETRTFQDLLLTRLGRARILLGKAAALLIQNAPALVWLAGHLVIIYAVGLPRGFRPVGGLFGLALAAAFSIALGFYYSLAARRPSDAGGAVLVTWIWLTGMGVGIVSAAAHNGMPAPLAAVLAAAGIVGLTVALGRRRGYGAWLPALSYIAVVVLVVSVVALCQMGPADFISEMRPRGASAFYERQGATVGLMFLPVAFYSAGFTGSGSSAHGWAAAGPYVVLCIQVVVLGWMVFSTFRSFEAQARRAY